MIPLDIRANLLLVDKGIRPAMLIQPQDYTIKLNLILSFIHKHYPDLICTDNYEIYQGVIVSKKAYKSPISLEKMGKILDYFCKFDEAYSIRVMLYGEEKCELFVNMCSTLDDLPKFEKFAFQANEVLYELGVVRIEYTKNISIQEIVQKINQHKMLTDDDFHSINVNLQSLFHTKSIPAICDAFDYDNEFHKGILISLLLMEKYPLASPFYPVSQEKNDEMSKIAHAMQTSFISILKDHKKRGWF
jgi:hypothetical protein